MSDTYTDSDGNACTLEVMCRREPEWAANRLRADRERLRRLVAAVRGVLRHADRPGPCEHDCAHRWCAIYRALEACEEAA